MTSPRESMTNPPKHSELRLTLNFSGLRWPRCEAVLGPHRAVMPRSVGFESDRQGYADISVAVASGKGRPWTPELADATWRTLSELDLSDPAACADFVSRRGDPTSALQPDRPVISLHWANLAETLTLAALAWQPLDAHGNSWPIKDRAARDRVREQFLTMPYVQMVFRPTYHFVVGGTGVLKREQETHEMEIGFGASSSGLTLNPQTLGAFLILRAIHALADPVPMRRCLHCSYWFEIRRIQRRPQFCSPSCRAIYHQENPSNGKLQKEHHEGGDAALAKRVAAARPKRQVAAKDKELRKPEGSTRPRPADGKGRAPRRRRSSKA
jgi:hypothetical protein